jgi:hypothetical protein
MEKRRLGFDEFFVGFLDFRLEEPAKVTPPCERNESCTATVCPFCNGARHKLAMSREPMLPGLCLQLELPF